MKQADFLPVVGGPCSRTGCYSETKPTLPPEGRSPKQVGARAPAPLHESPPLLLAKLEPLHRGSPCTPVGTGGGPARQPCVLLLLLLLHVCSSSSSSSSSSVQVSMARQGGAGAAHHRRDHSVHTAPRGCVGS